MAYKCTQCGREHDELPALAFIKPGYWLGLTPDQQAAGKIDDDLCTTHDGHHFVRAVLHIPILDGPKGTLEYGPWGTLSKENFWRYVETYNDADQSKIGAMFSWFANDVNGFARVDELKCDLLPQDDNKRPQLRFQTSDHPLAMAQRNGISWETALKLAHAHLGEGWKA